MLTVRKKICLAVCPNVDGWHKGIFVAYMILPDKIVDEPDLFTWLKMVNAWEGMSKFTSISYTCIHCQRRLARRNHA